MKATKQQLNDTIKMGHDLTAAFLSGLKAQAKNRKSDEIPINAMHLHVMTYIKADKKQASQFKGDALRAFNDLATWKGKILQQLFKSISAWCQQNDTDKVPLRIVEGLVAIVNEKIAS